MLTETPVSRAARGGLARDVPICALTFDDGPNGPDTLRLLDFLRERRIRAVFAVIGEEILKPGGADVLRRIVADGHVLCHHSTSFADMGDWDALTVRDDMLRGLAIIEEATGDAAPVPYWRAPNGSWGVTAPVAVRLGMQPLAVTGTIGDWEEQDAEVLAERLRAVMEPGAVVLVHDGGGDRAGTIDAVIEVVDDRLGQGWQFVLPEMP